ncbi:UNVERIFIED_CONTAM: hypothetical protein Slati_4499400 [Sesamum latifolium]|uniref:Integrase catalytic domain-containing protein n=1 Tax=Sesamum latifolium TaxID=2727402 RepID=A0AAW2ST69_9LAMI
MPRQTPCQNLQVALRIAGQDTSPHYLPEARTPLAVQPITTGEDWRTPIIKWIKEGLLPENQWEAARLKTRATRFIIQEHILYKKSYTHPLLRFLSTEEGIHSLQEIHSGCCGAHVGTRILANKALRAGYFWPTMKQDAIRLVSKQWGIDIVGPFPLAAGQRKFLLVAVDYFTKWVEAESLALITEGEVMKFIWKNIICRFGIPRKIISDNGRQFQGRKIQEWCQGLRIKQLFTTAAHPQANGQVEVTNRILDNPRGSTGETPFSLVYGTEAIIPAELGMPSHRVGPSVSLGPKKEGEVPSGTEAEAGGASEGPAGGIAGAFSFFSAGSPSLGTTPSMESVAATGGDSSLLPPLHLGGYQGHPLIKETDDG